MPGRLDLLLLECERKLLNESVLRHGGRVKDVAKDLGLTLRQAYSKLAKHGLSRLSVEQRRQEKIAARERAVAHIRGLLRTGP
jgi:DNA-binding NtrC family response regulator